MMISQTTTMMTAGTDRLFMGKGAMEGPVEPVFSYTVLLSRSIS